MVIVVKLLRELVAAARSAGVAEELLGRCTVALDANDLDVDPVLALTNAETRLVDCMRALKANELQTERVVPGEGPMVFMAAGDIVTVDPGGISPSFHKIDVSIPFLVTAVGGSNLSRHWTSLNLVDAEEFSRDESTTVALAVPTVHLNGTSRGMLVKELETAYDALGAAYEAMRECGPNGRDYYPQGPGALERAIRQHFDRLSRVDSVRSELEALIGKISEAGK